MLKLLVGLLLLKLDENKTTVLIVIGLLLLAVSVTSFALTGFDLSQVLGLAIGNIFICLGAKLTDKEKERR